MQRADDPEWTKDLASVGDAVVGDAVVGDAVVDDAVVGGGGDGDGDGDDVDGDEDEDETLIHRKGDGAGAARGVDEDEEEDTLVHNRTSAAAAGDPAPARGQLVGTVTSIGTPAFRPTSKPAQMPPMASAPGGTSTEREDSFDAIARRTSPNAERPASSTAALRSRPRAPSRGPTVTASMASTSTSTSTSTSASTSTSTSTSTSSPSPQPRRTWPQLLARIVKRLLIVGTILGLLGALAGVGGIVGVFWYYGRGVEGVDVAAIRNYRPEQVTRITARDGTVIGELYSERRTLVPIEEIPKHVELAFLAAEDADFHNHEGMDYMGMVRALIANVQAGQLRQGASTITQQVVKNFLLSPERTIDRKVQELILARRLEKALTKNEILELYLNEIYFGHGRYGVEEASQFYFGKSVRDINLGQAAMLAGLPKAPGKSSPYKAPRKAKVRQIYVLQQMVRHGFATARDADEAIDRELEILDKPRESVTVRGAQEFVDAARAKLVEIYGEERLDTLGATVVTTVDLELQKRARESVRGGLIALDKRQGYGHKVKPLSSKRIKQVRAKVKGDIVVGQTYPVIVAERAPAMGLGEDEVAGTIGEQQHKIVFRVPPRYDDPDKTLAEQFPATGVTMVRVTALAGQEGGGGHDKNDKDDKDDEVVEGEGDEDAGDADVADDAGDKARETGDTPRTDVARGVIDSGPEAALVLADAASGEVLAMIGGYEHRRGDFNRVLDAERQPGSSFKPFIYGAALASEQFTAATLVSDSPEIYEKWRPTNYEVDVYRGDIRVREALTHSVNTVAIKLLDAVGIEAALAFARAAGIRAELSPNLSIALGTSEVKPVDLLAGYLTLSRRGNRVEPILIRRIEAPGEPAWEPVQRGEQTLREDVVFVLTSMMTSVVQEGTGKGAKALGRPVAAKTGTSAQHRDAWFAGFTPRHVAVAWVGFDAPKPVGKGESGGRAALPIWLSLMQAAESRQPPAAFVPPATVLVRTIDKQTGLLAPDPVPLPDGTLSAPPPESLLEEYFLAGTAPVDRAEPAAMAPGDTLLDLYEGLAPDPVPVDPNAQPQPTVDPTGDALLDLYGDESDDAAADSGPAPAPEPARGDGREGAAASRSPGLPSVLDEDSSDGV